ncbi:DUF6980 family protein [Cryptosporangium phraense]|uniref:DUF6980 family protein n=1 Tax=Cryptosporangium phraense TaxID=2593070 RepID=UPI003B846E84
MRSTITAESTRGQWNRRRERYTNLRYAEEESRCSRAITSQELPIFDHTTCDQLGPAVLNPDVPLTYSAAVREVTLAIRDGGTSGIEVRYCPWCGVSLPISLREVWIEEILGMGFQPESATLPAEFRSEDWWRARGL